MVATKALLFVVLSAVFSSVVVSGAQLDSGIHMRHRALNRGLSVDARAPFANPRALHRRCKARHTYAPEEPETTKKADPTTTKEKKPDPTPDTSNDEPKNNNDNNNNNNNNDGGSSGGPGGYYAGTNHGEVTFYTTGLGACGRVNTDSDYICAVSHALFDSYPGAGDNPNKNPICGQQIRATVNGKTITVTVTDRCEGCAPQDLDFSPDAFASVASHADGRIPMTWQWA